VTPFFTVRVRPQVRVHADPARGCRVSGLARVPVPVAAPPAPAATSTGASLVAPTSLVALGSLHRRPPRPVAPVVPDWAPVPGLAELVRDARREQVDGLGWFQVGRRVRAAARARAVATQRAAVLAAAAEHRRSEDRSGLARAYERLVVNDEETVLATLARVLGEMGSPAAAVGVDHRELTLVVVVPDVSVLPEEYPVTGPGGNLEVRPVTAGLAGEWYRQLVAGQAVLATRQAFAACPGLDLAAVVVVRQPAPRREHAGGPGADVLLATRLSRSRLDRLHWAAVTAWDVVETAGDQTLVAAGEAGALAPLDLGDQPGLADLAAAVEF